MSSSTNVYVILTTLYLNTIIQLLPSTVIKINVVHKATYSSVKLGDPVVLPYATVYSIFH